jgi:hypothetical protein
MSVRERIIDAKLLWDNGRKQGAWIQVLIAAAATSRVRFPTMRDGEAFRAFVREVTPTIINGAPAIPGGVRVIFNAEGPDQMSLDEVLYNHLRCTLVHEGVMPAEVQFSESRFENGQWKADVRGGLPLTIPDFWVVHLAKAVADAPENAATCAGVLP